MLLTTIVLCGLTQAILLLIALIMSANRMPFDPWGRRLQWAMLGTLVVTMGCFFTELSAYYH